MGSLLQAGFSFAGLKPEDPAIIRYQDVKSTIVHIIPALHSKQGCHSYPLRAQKVSRLAVGKTYPRFEMVSWTRLDSLRVQRLCQKEDNVRGSNKDTNVG